ncbi:MAG TPA: GNAT family N-acetyltransferase [Ktedonobacteraceae bacterium]
MAISMHSYSAADRQRVIDFRRAGTTVANVSDYPTVVDLYELLDASAAHEAVRISLWEDKSGDLVAFAIVALQYCNCYFQISPHIRHHEIETGILNWAEHQIREMERCSAVDTPCRDTDSERIALLERKGFVQQEVQTLTMARLLSDPIPPAIFPEGFTLRQVAGEQEVDALVALHQEAFGTQNMTREMRRAIIRNPEYLAELDLLLEAPDGTLAAFCYCTIPREANELSRCKKGEVAIIGTKPSYSKKGLGRAMLLTALQRFKDVGVETATLGTSSENTRAQSVAASAGFRISSRSLWYSKDISFKQPFV